MGQCYSCQANSGRGPYFPSADMSSQPITKGRPTSLGSKRTANPAYRYKKVPQHNGQEQRRNSNEQPDDRAALATIDDNSPVSRPKAVKTEYNTNLNRFGFRPTNKLGKSDSNSNVMTISSDSLDNIEIDVVKRKDQPKSGSGKTGRPRSYEPPKGLTWKMIDDSSTTDSRSVSTQGTQGNQEAATDANGNGHVQRKAERTSLASKLQSGDKKLTRALEGAASKGLIKPGKAPLAKLSPKNDRWVKAEATDLDDRQRSPNRGKSRSPNKSPAPSSSSQTTSQPRLMSRARGWFNSYGSRTSQLETKPKAAESKEIKSGLSKLKPGKSQATEKPTKKEVKKLVPARSPVSPDSSEPSFEECERGKSESGMKDSFTKDSGIGSDSLDAQDLSAQNVPLPRPSLVKKDSLDAGSICSLNSDDLMLDLDFNFDEDLTGASSSTLERSAFLNMSQASSVTAMRDVPLEASCPYAAPHRERACSQGSDMERPSAGSCSGDTATASKPPVRPGSLTRRHTESTLPRPRTNSWKELRAKNSLNEALSELSALIETSPSPSKSQTEAPGIQRRNPKLQRGNRPASFPGPGVSGGAVGGVEEGRSPLKPPRTSPSFGDDEQFSMDAFSYRQMLQDLTSIKTMALRLKRVVQEEDLGSQAWKNGYKYGSSQPSSPLAKDGQYSFSGPPSSANTPTMETIIQENFHLRQQLIDMQQRLDEQDKTILRLQEKMNKAEVSTKGKSAGPASSQPRLSSYRSLPRPGGAGGSGSVLTKPTTRGRSEISSYSDSQSSREGSCQEQGANKKEEVDVHGEPDKDNKENLGTTKDSCGLVETREATGGARAKRFSGAGKTVKPTTGHASPRTSGSRGRNVSAKDSSSIKGPAAPDRTAKRPSSGKTESAATKSSLPQSKGLQSRLPLLNVRKVTKKSDQLQSFSKISKN